MKKRTGLSFQISRISRLQRNRFDQRARSLGVTLSQWRAIYAISQEAGASQRRIADTLEIGDVATGRLIDRMVESGWVERRDDPADRRMHRLYLTSAALALLDRLSALGADEEAMALSGIDRADVERALAVLGQVIGNLERAIGASLPEPETTASASAGGRPPPSSALC